MANFNSKKVDVHFDMYSFHVGHCKEQKSRENVKSWGGGQRYRQHHQAALPSVDTFLGEAFNSYEDHYY